jgi:hypothetical protein
VVEVQDDVLAHIRTYGVCCKLAFIS